MITNFFAALAAAVQLISAGSLYPAALDVVDVTPDRVTFAAHSGHLYQTLDPEDWMPGDKAVAIMLDSGTPGDPEDDIVLRVRYTR